MSATTDGLSAEQSTFLMESAMAARALETAERLGVLARLERGPVDVAGLAQDCAIGERGARRLLGALAALGVAVAAGGGTYRSAVPHPALLAWVPRQWEGLDEAVRTGRPACALPLGTAMAAGLTHACSCAAASAAARLDGSGPRVLDVVAGAAPWSVAVARRMPAVHVTAVDWPERLALAQETVAAAGLAARYDYLGGDVFSLDFGVESFDLAIAGNLCDRLDEAGVRRLLARTHQALRRGGRLAIVDAIANERLDGPRAVMLYALDLLARTAGGEVYPLSTYHGWLVDIGFQHVECYDLGAPGLLNLITARRP